MLKDNWSECSHVCQGNQTNYSINHWNINTIYVSLLTWFCNTFNSVLRNFRAVQIYMAFKLNAFIILYEIGTQYREYLCLREEDSQRVSDIKCKEKRPRSQIQKCNRHCTLRYEWFIILFNISLDHISQLPTWLRDWLNDLLIGCRIDRLIRISFHSLVVWLIYSLIRSI